MYNNYTNKIAKKQGGDGDMTAVIPDIARAAIEIAKQHVTKLEAALIYASCGVPVFPCNLLKRPMCEHGFKDADTDIERITRFWTSKPGALIGIPTGEPSGVFVIDIDGAAGWKNYNAILRGIVPETLWAKTGSGSGAHVMFKFPGELRNTAGALGDHLDTRGAGGYIVAPPSVTHRAYTFQNPGAPLAEMPPELIAMCQPAESETRETFKAEPGTISDARLASWYGSVIQGECRDVERTPEGSRNSRLFCAAGRCGQVALRCGLAVDAPGHELLNAATAAGLGKHEASLTIWSGFREATKRGAATDPSERMQRRQ